MLNKAPSTSKFYNSLLVNESNLFYKISLLQAKPKESETHKKTFKEQIACDEANKEYAVGKLVFIENLFS